MSGNNFFEDENCIIVIPTANKPVKIVFENECEIEAVNVDTMEFTLAKKTSLEEMAKDMEMSAEELLELITKNMEAISFSEDNE